VSRIYPSASSAVYTELAELTPRPCRRASAVFYWINRRDAENAKEEIEYVICICDQGVKVVGSLAIVRFSQIVSLQQPNDLLYTFLRPIK
jgi:hypothetical protein